MLTSHVRSALLLSSLGGGIALAQGSGLPANAPTSGITNMQPARSLSKAVAADRPVVTYSGNILQVTANNSSLNQILREISRQSGMKITGGVADERVYGKFGPAPPAEVLADLLDGTKVNMFLQQESQDAPAELVLTPRNGGPTPPNPNAAGFDDDAQVSPPILTPPAPVSQGPQPARLPFSRPVPTPPLTCGP